jgi:predicted amidohydrolase YtcJ
VGATIQPLWAYCDPYIKDLTLPILDAERINRLYPLKSLADNARLAGGSDWTVSSMNPLEAMQVAVTRRGPEEGPGEAWLPDQIVDLQSVLEAYTVGGAYRSFQENETGTLSVGKSADLVVLERDLFQIPPTEIGQTRILWTFFRGRPVYHAD